MNNDIKIRQGSRLTFTIQRADIEAVSATFIALLDDYMITDTVAYNANGEAYFEFGSPDTDIAGEYEYQVNENFPTGSPDIYPKGDCDDCDFPKLEICESLEVGS